MNRKIGIVMENSVEYVKLLLSIWREEDCAVLLDWRLPAGQILQMLALSGAEECYLEKSLQPKFPKQASILFHWVDAPLSHATRFPVSLYQDFSFSQSEKDAVILFSSGTTGKAKGIVLSYRALFYNSSSVADYLQITPGDCFYISKALSHSSSVVGELLVALRFGAGILLAPTRVPPRVALRCICEERATLLCVNPVMLQLFLKTQKRLKWKLPLRAIYTSGAVAGKQLMLDAREAFFPIPVLDAYGLSEAGPRVSAQRPGTADTPGSVGLPVAGVQIQIRGEEGALCKPNCQGTIFVRTQSKMTKYLNSPSPFQGEWLNTGDLGFLSQTGELFVLGRADDRIVQEAHNLDPDGIEEVLRSCPGLEDCLVFGVDDSRFGQRAVCLYAASQELQEELYRHARQHLADYEIPKEFHRVSSLPVTVTGKRSRKLARLWYQEQGGNIS